MRYLELFKKTTCLFEEIITNDINKSRIINKAFPHIYLISLCEDSNIIRSTHINIVLRNLGANYTILFMKRPSEQVYTEYLNFYDSHLGTGFKKLTKCELGCVISHAWALQKKIRACPELSLILEDDIMPAHDFEKKLGSIIEETTILETGKLLMLSSIDYFCEERNTYNEKFIPTKEQGIIVGAGAYAINNEKAKVLVKLLHSLEKPADYYFTDLYEDIHDINEGFVCWPPLLICDYSQSTIGNSKKVGTKPYYDKLSKCFMHVNIDNYNLFPLVLLDNSCEFTVVKDALKNPTFDIKRHFLPIIPLQFNSSLDSLLEEENCKEEQTIYVHNELYTAFKRSTWAKEQFIELYDKISPTEIVTSMPNDLAACIAFFNPAKRKRPLQNLLYCWLKIRNIGIPVYLIEVVYKGRKSELLNMPNVFRVKSNSYLFHKENLWNILVKKIPSNYKKLVFFDSDIVFRDSSWASRISTSLETYNFLQPYDLATKLDINYKPDDAYISYMKAYDNRKEDVFSKFHTYPSLGYIFACQRSWLEKIGGFLDMCIIGGGDHIFCTAITNVDISHSPSLFKNLPYIQIEYNRLTKNLKTENFKCGYLNLRVDHLYHGKEMNRQYSGRSELIKTLTAMDFQVNSDSVIEFKEPEKWNPVMLKYFKDRNDDDI